MAKKYKVAYIDWDGVLWDFKQAYCDWTGYDVPTTTKWEFYEDLGMGMSASAFQAALAKLPHEFWVQQRYIMPHAHDLVAWARKNADKVFVLTVAPEWDCSKAKQSLASSNFGLSVYTVAKAADKIEYAKKGCLLIDDKDTTVIRFVRETVGSCGYVWPAEYNEGLDWSWYFKKSWLHEHKAKWALSDSDRSDMMKDEIAGFVDMLAVKSEQPEVPDMLGGTGSKRWDRLYTTDIAYVIGDKAEKPKLDYEAMDEAKKRKMTPMYSGLLAYFPDALAVVAQNSMVGHYQHNDPEEPMHWDREKSADDADAMLRHMADHSKDPYDADGRLHLGKATWRALAMLQKFLEDQAND